MIRVIVLDSTPLGLLVQRPTVSLAEQCRIWLKGQLSLGVKVVVPEIVYYELRRELLRPQRHRAVDSLIEFTHGSIGRYLPITTSAMDLAAELWAKARQQGKPTAHPHALDVDVILSAQLIAAGLDPAEFVVATSNLSHISMFVPAASWETITG